MRTFGGRILHHSGAFLPERSWQRTLRLGCNELIVFVGRSGKTALVKPCGRPFYLMLVITV